MGNCWRVSGDSRKPKKNPFAPDAGGGGVRHHPGGVPKGMQVLNNLPVGHNIHEKFVLGRELGRGEFGITYLCTDKVAQNLLACKSISKRKLKSNVDVDDVRREVAIMQHLPGHPNIVQLKSVFEDDVAVHLVMELCEGGELFDRIVARGHYTERAAADLTRTIVEVVQVCHKHGVMHRDLKPENFLFANRKEHSPLKAIDFGLSVFFKPGEKFSEIVGSPYYMAPEVLKRNYGPEVDVWSAGVILYILLCGVPPFWAETEQGVAQAILRGLIDFKRDPWPKVSDSAKSLVRQMLEPDPKLRLSAQQVLDHIWLHKASKASRSHDVSLGGVRAKLKQFAAVNKFKKAALKMIAGQMSEEEIQGLREMLDGNSGAAAAALSALKADIASDPHLKDSEVKLAMEGVDGRGPVDYGKFAAATVHLQSMDNFDDYLRKAFSQFDKDESGFIDMEELQQGLSEELGPNDGETLQDIFKEVDIDKDGKISFEEFAQMMQTGTDWRKASRHYSRRRFDSLSIKLMRDGSLQATM
eukprot:TRINITY_DN192_c0_g1_i1.p1 TRINITY_DN192_c0_g1~~TRINITY_DN192_c0_g1_i1.p1  ORF type:complete len:527 (-),score=95.92 TRINITY_DN192_c0_g1_i1:978-2558(-)